MTTRLESRRTDRQVLPGVSVPGLTRYLEERLGVEGLDLRSVRVAGQGMSDDTILVDGLDSRGSDYAVAIRRYRHDGILRAMTDPERHFRTLQALERTTVPAPLPLWHDPDGGELGGPTIGMSRLEGAALVPWSPAGRDFLRQAGEGPLGERFVALLAEIHALDWRGLGLGDRSGPGQGARDRVETLRTTIEAHPARPEPLLTYALGWLTAHAPDAAETVLVHGDYRTGNLLFGDHTISGVLDWELASPGDPMMDLAWVLAPSNRMGSPLASYILEPERLVALYEEYSGRGVRWDAVRFWQVYFQTMNAVGWVNAAHNVAHGVSSDLRLLRWSYTLPTMRQLLLDALREVS
ncbi:phosphotransferase family protein [Sporichthya polymorpha]|uniref:phosphotransferase family protein n=1 Tax=Sporichthya polymorpha TaxID=35751 RepID=UPI0003A31769|nr:phosphotransferase family protein [Sporichthya polymorpha]